jgi:hypothetical protein
MSIHGYFEMCGYIVHVCLNDELFPINKEISLWTYVFVKDKMSWDLDSLGNCIYSGDWSQFLIDFIKRLVVHHSISDDINFEDGCIQLPDIVISTYTFHFCPVSNG